MNGLVCCSAESGILILAEAFQQNFGFGNIGNDAMQLASTLFALLQMSKELPSDLEQNDADRISYLHNEDAICYFVEEQGFQLIVSCVPIMPKKIILNICSAFIQVLISVQVSNAQPPKQSIRKRLQSEFLRICFQIGNNLVSKFASNFPSASSKPCNFCVFKDPPRAVTTQLPLANNAQCNTGEQSSASDSWCSDFSHCWEFCWRRGMVLESVENSLVFPAADDSKQPPLVLQNIPAYLPPQLFAESDLVEACETLLSSCEVRRPKERAGFVPFPRTCTITWTRDNAALMRSYSVDAVSVDNIVFFWWHQHASDTITARDEFLDLFDSSSMVRADSMVLMAWVQFCASRESN